MSASGKTGLMMLVVRLLPVLLSFLLLAAHFWRAENTPLVLLSVVYPFLLLVRRPWVAHAVRFALVLGGLEWIRRTIVLVGQRQEAGAPWTRLAIILLAVAAFTFAAALVFRAERLRAWYGRNDGLTKEGH
jgi:hypothetical protein